jgi:hypothetical protein
MALLSGSLASLINGVSQQPAWMRLPSQAAVQQNALSSLVDGVKRRPSREHVASLSATSFGDAHIHTINRDPNKRYVVVVVDEDLKVFDLDGVEQTVNFPNGKAYLSAVAPETAFACTTLADFTFVVNKEKIVGETNANNSVDNYLYLYVKQAFYNCSYGVYIDGSLVATHTTSATGSAPQTNSIAGSLTSALSGALSGWTVTQFDNVIRLKKNDNTVHTIGAYDSQGNVGLIAFGRAIQSFVDLPPTNVPNGTTVEITGTASNGFDGYWVKFDAAKQSWVETVKQEDEARPTPSTMPWKLVQEVDNTWTFDMIDWGWRTCGDATTAPSPSLIGRTVNDILVHRNRMFILADQNVLASRPGGPNFFELFPSTVTTTLDSDPIDAGLSSDISAVPIAKFATPFAEDLLIWTEPAQFKLGTGDQTLTASAVKATQVSAYSTSLRAKPSVNGKLVHFPIEKGSNSGLREGFIDRASLVFDATDVTVHVPSYITGVITRLCSAINRDTLFVLADGDRHRVWVYKWFIENDTKLQSSWSEWVFPNTDTILDISYMDSSVYLVVERSTGVFLERMRLDESYTDDGLEFSVRFDRKVAVTGTYNSGTNRTTWTLPYDYTYDTIVGAFGADFTNKPGFEMPALTRTNPSAGTISLGGRHDSGPCYFGRRYSTVYTLSTISVATASSDGRGRTPITDGRLQLRNIYINYGSTGFFRVTVAAPGRDTFTYTFQPNKLGQTLVVGERSLASGRFRVPVHARNTDVTITIESDSHYPCSLLSIDWEGEFTLRSRRTQ